MMKTTHSLTLLSAALMAVIIGITMNMAFK